MVGESTVGGWEGGQGFLGAFAVAGYCGGEGGCGVGGCADDSAAAPV